MLSRPGGQETRVGLLAKLTGEVTCKHVGTNPRAEGFHKHDPYGRIAGILRRTLAIRHKIAANEARRATLEKAHDSQQVRASFQTHPEFGKR